MAIFGRKRQPAAPVVSSRRRSSRINILPPTNTNGVLTSARYPDMKLPWYCQVNGGVNYTNNNMVRRKRPINSLSPTTQNPDTPWPTTNYANGFTYTHNKEPYNNINGDAIKEDLVYTPPHGHNIIIYREEKKDAKTLKSLFSHSNVPGLRELALSDGIMRKVYWLIAFLGLGFICLSDIHQLLSEFYSYPITVDVRLREERKLPFPLVTVCNLNTVRFSAICNSTLNISIPIELKQKLCGISLNEEPSNTSSTDIEDINDILGETKKDAETPVSPAAPADGSLPEEEKEHRMTTIHPDPGLDLNEPDDDDGPNGHKNSDGGKDRHHRGKRQSSRGGGQQVTFNTRSRKPPDTSGSGSSSGGSGGSGSSGSGSSGKGGGGGGGKGKGQQHNLDDSPLMDEIELTEREEKELQENLTTW